MITLGSKVRDLVTGKVGFAVARTEWLYGCARIGLEAQELNKDGKREEIGWYDEQRIEEIEKNAFPITPNPEVNIKLGSKVKDKLTGFTGMAVAKTCWTSGNVSFAVEPTTLHEGKPIDPHSFEWQRIELIEEKAPPVSKDNSATSGGPQKDPVRRF
jgi:hypothetical protein